MTTALFAAMALLNVIGVGGWWTLTGAGAGRSWSPGCSATTKLLALTCRRLHRRYGNT